MPESFPMKGGDGPYSYTNNSQVQRKASNAVKEMIDEAIAEKLDIETLTSTSETIRIADLGCSVGPNTFITMKNGIISESQVDMFNLPIYSACPKEITRLVERNGCFSIERLELCYPMSNIDEPVNVQTLTMQIRAGLGEIFSHHFGLEIMDELIKRTSRKYAEISPQLLSGIKEAAQLFVVLKHK